MLLNYLKITFRNLYKHKAYSLITIFGLSLGIACCLLIISYIGYELSFDGYHKNAGQIYRLTSRRTISGNTRESTVSVAPVGPTMVQDFPEVVDAVRFGPTVKRAFRYEDKNFFQENVFYVDKSVFHVFSFELIEGDPGTALEVPFTMVLTESTAQKYFGNESPMGKIIKCDNNFDYRITGVVKNPHPIPILHSLSWRPFRHSSTMIPGSALGKVAVFLHICCCVKTQKGARFVGEFYRGASL